MIDNTFRLRYKSIPAAIHEKSDFCETPLHNHEEIEVIIIDNGVSHIRVGGKTYECHGGDLIFINPMEVHSVTVAEKSQYRHRCICFDSELIPDKVLAADISGGHLMIPNYIKVQNTELRQLCVHLFDAVSLEAAFIEAASYAGLIMAFFIKNGLLQKSTGSTNRDNFCQSVLEYVRSHFGEHISSKTAAEAMSFNQSYFCRRFSKNIGMSFSEYLNMYRVSVSRTLLEDSGKSISDIAYKCGFSDPIYFTRCFKKYTGILPSVYRKKSI